MNPANFVILVQCATRFEFEALRVAFKNPEPEFFGKRKLIRMTQGSQTWIALLGAFGKVWAAASCEFGISHFSPNIVIDFGAAGALTQDLNIGDFVLANKIVEHDFHPTIGNAPEILVDTSKIDSSKDFKVGGIASGDKDMESPEERFFLGSKTKCIAVTWESSAIARVCQFHGVSFLSLRVITDTGAGPLLAEYKKNAPPLLEKAAQKLLNVISF